MDSIPPMKPTNALLQVLLVFRETWGSITFQTKLQNWSLSWFTRIQTTHVFYMHSNSRIHIFSKFEKKEVISIHRTQSYGVTCKPRCYLALSARCIEADPLFFMYRRKPVINTLKILGATARNLVAWGIKRLEPTHPFSNIILSVTSRFF
jgi:hypothetical protein